MNTTIRILRVGLALTLTGCASYERSARQTPAASQSFTNLYYLPGQVVMTVHAPNTPFVYVAGEVKLPGRIVWTNGLTLVNAIDLAGGFSDFASESRITLRRTGGPTEQYSFGHVPSDSTSSPTLHPADVVYVPARHLVWQWP